MTQEGRRGRRSPLSRPEGAGVEPLPEAGSVRIPDKLFFRIGEVSRLTGVRPYVLRFWESEFPSLQPKKSGTGQRLYRKRDIQMVLRIKELLYRDRFTIAGAKRKLAEEGLGDANPLEVLRRVREGLEGIIRTLRP